MVRLELTDTLKDGFCVISSTLERRSWLCQGTSVVSLNQDQKSWHIFLKIIGGLQHIRSFSHSFIHSFTINQAFIYSFIHHESHFIVCSFVGSFINSFFNPAKFIARGNFSKHSVKAILEEGSRS